MPKNVAGTLTIRINPDGPLASLQAALREAIARMAFGLGAAGAYKSERLELPVFPQVLMGKPVAISEARRTFRPWLVGALLRDCIEGLDSVLRDVWQVSKLLRVPTQAGLVHSRDLAAFQTAQENFTNLALGQKIGNLRQEFPHLIPASWVRPLRQIVDLRNCLVHGNGLVRKRDLNASRTLVVTWRATEFLILYEGATPAKISRPTVLKRDGTAAIRERWRRRIFKLGQRVEISVQEFAEIAWSLFAFAVDLRSSWAEQELKPRGLIAPEVDLSRKLQVVMIDLSGLAALIASWAAEVAPESEIYLAQADWPQLQQQGPVRMYIQRPPRDLESLQEELSAVMQRPVQLAMFDPAVTAARLFPP